MTLIAVDEPAGFEFINDFQYGITCSTNTIIDELHEVIKIKYLPDKYYFVTLKVNTKSLFGFNTEQIFNLEMNGDHIITYKTTQE